MPTMTIIPRSNKDEGIGTVDLEEFKKHPKVEARDVADASYYGHAVDISNDTGHKGVLMFFPYLTIETLTKKEKTQ